MHTVVERQQFSEEFYERWQHLLDDIDMQEVPLTFVNNIVVNLSNGETVDFNIPVMIKDKLTTREIERVIERFLAEHDEFVSNIDFHIDIEAVAREVSIKTSKLLDT